MELLTEFTTHLIIDDSNQTINFSDILIVENLSTYKLVHVEESSFNQIYYNSSTISFYNPDTNVKIIYKTNQSGFSAKQIFDCIINFYKNSKNYENLKKFNENINFEGLYYNQIEDSYMIKLVS